MKTIKERARELYPYCDGILSNDDIKYNVEMKAQRDNFIKIETEFREIGRQEERALFEEQYDASFREWKEYGMTCERAEWQEKLRWINSKYNYPIVKENPYWINIKRSDVVIHSRRISNYTDILMMEKLEAEFNWREIIE